MITFSDIKNVALPCVALRKKELHQRMLSTSTDDELISLKRCIDEYSKFERFLTTECKKENSSYLQDLNK